MELFQNRKDTKERMAIYFEVLLDFQHILKDSNYCENTISMQQAIERTWFWTEQERVKILYPTDDSFKRAQVWMNMYNLGENRLVDTHMAATYADAGVSTLWTANPKSFEVFQVFDITRTKNDEE